MQLLIKPSTRTNPFPGLRPFLLGEEDLFFGREGQSDQLLERLYSERFLAIVGASGSGKSSLVRAGLLPSLYSGLLVSANEAWRGVASSKWKIAIFRPGNDPTENLAEALNRPEVFGRSPDEKDASIYAALNKITLKRGHLGLVEVAQQARMVEKESLLVVVDQFEELFRFKQSAQSLEAEDKAAAFVKLLLSAVKQRDVPIFVVLTMRSDFIGDCAQFRDLPEALNDSQYLVPRLTRSQLKDAIQGPVAVANGEITPQLVNRLLNDAGEDPDQLPILQHALMRTWEYASTSQGPLDMAHYEAIGGAREALSRHADQIYRKLPDERSRQLAQNIFKAITDRGPDNREIRRPLKLKQICEVTGASPKEAITVINAFSGPQCSFLTPPAATPKKGDSVIDISHESLMRNWQQLKAWIDEEASSANIYRRLAQTAALQANQKAEYYRGPELSIALEWLEKQQPSQQWAQRYAPNFEQSKAFLKESEKAELKFKQAEKRKLQASVVFGLSFLILSVFLGWSVREQKRINRQVENAEIAATAEKLIVQSNQIRTTQPNLRPTAALLAVEAFNQLQSVKESTVEAKGNLQRSILQLPQAIYRSQDTNTHAFSPNNRYIATGGSNGKVSLIDTTSQKLVSTASHDYSVSKVIFSSDSQYLATLGSDHQAKLIDVKKREEIAEVEHSDPIFDISFSNNGQYLSTRSKDGIAKVIDTQTGDLITTIYHDAPTGSNYFSSDSNTLITTSGDGAVRMVNLKTKVVTNIAEYSDDQINVVFSSDSKYVALYPTKESKEIEIISTETGENIKTLSYEEEIEGLISKVIFSPSSAYLAVGTSEGALEIFDLTTKTVVSTAEYQGRITELAFDVEGNRLAVSMSGSEDSIDIIDLATKKTIHELETYNDATTLSFSADGKYLIAQSYYEIEIFDLEKDALVNDIYHSGGIGNVAISPDEQYVATYDNSGVVRIIKLSVGEISSLFQHSGIDGFSFSDSSEYLATRGSDKTAKVIEVETGKIISSIEHESAISEMSFSKNSRYFATNDLSGAFKSIEIDNQKSSQSQFRYKNSQIDRSFDEDKKRMALALDQTNVKVIDAASGEVLVTSTSDASIENISFSDSGRYLATRDTGYSVKIVDVETREEISDIDHDFRVKGLAISNDEKYIATGTGDGFLRIIDLSTGDLIEQLEIPDDDWTYQFTGDGQYILTRTPRGKIRGIRASTGEQIYAIDSSDDEEGESDQGSWNMKVSENGKFFVMSNAQSPNVKVYKTETGEMVRELEHGDYVKYVTFSENSEHLLSRSIDNVIRVSNTTNADETAPIKVQTKNSIQWTKFSEDSKALAYYTIDGEVGIISTETEQTVSLDHDSSVNFLSFSEDSKYMATGSADKTAKLVEVATGEVVKTIESNGSVASVVFSENSQYIAAVSNDRTAQVVDVSTGEVVGFVEHSSEIMGVAFSPDSRIFATYGKDRVAQLIQTDGEQPINSIAHEDDITGIAFSEDSQYVATGSANGVVKLLKADTGEEITVIAHENAINFLTFNHSSNTLITSSVDASLYVTEISDTDFEVQDVCDRLDENLSVSTWKKYMGTPLEDYTLTCENAPVDISLLTEAGSLVEREKEKEAQSLLKRIQKIAPKTDLYPHSLDVETEIDFVIDVWKVNRLIKDGTQAAQSKKIEKAAESFKAAQNVIPGVDLNTATFSVDTDPEEIAKSIAARSIIKEKTLDSSSNPSVSRIQGILVNYQRAKELDPDADISSSQWDRICWLGSLNRVYEEVMTACDRAISQEPDYIGWRDSRGIARALKGDRAGAIEDFQAYINWNGSPPRRKEQRQQWVSRLQNGENPFTEALLKELREE